MARRYTCLPTLCSKLNESGWPNWSERSWHRSKEFHPRFMRCPLLTSDRLIFCHEVNLKFGMPNYLLKGCDDDDDNDDDVGGVTRRSHLLKSAQKCDAMFSPSAKKLLTYSELLETHKQGHSLFLHVSGILAIVLCFHE